MVAMPPVLSLNTFEVRFVLDMAQHKVVMRVLLSELRNHFGRPFAPFLNQSIVLINDILRRN